MRFCRPGRTEYEVCAELVHEFGRHGAEVSYHPIVGGGANSCVLHYRDNNQPLKDGDFIQSARTPGQIADVAFLCEGLDLA
jgi:Xaa-Pro aminopeptidase